jgi:hypothetical protein
MAYPSIPDVPGITQADPAIPSQKDNVKPANTSPTLTDDAAVQVLSPNNTGLPVNIPVILQKAGGVSTGNVTTLAQAFTNANVAGNSIVVVAGVGNGTAMTVADSAGNTYTSAIAAPNSSTFAAQIFWASGILAGANTVTVTNGTTGASMAVEIYEVSGLIAQAQAQPGQTSTGTGSAATVLTSTISPGSPNSLVFAGVAIGTGVVTAMAAGTGLTYDSGTQQPVTPSGLYQFASFSGFLGTMGGITPTATWTTSRASAMAAAIFRPVVLGVEGTVRIGGYNYTHISTATTTLIKTGPGTLHAVVCNTPVGSGVIEIDDALTHTTPVVGIITFPATILSIGQIPYTYDISFAIGLSITTTGTMDLTVVWK